MSTLQQSRYEMAEAQRDTSDNVPSSSKDNIQNANDTTLTGHDHHEASRQDSRYLTENSDVKAKSKRAEARQNGIQQLKDRTQRGNKAPRGRVRRRGPSGVGCVHKTQRPESGRGNTGTTEVKAADRQATTQATGNSQPRWNEDMNLGRPGQDPAWEYDHSD